MFEVDEVDLRIIGALQSDGRRSVVDVSRELGIPRSTVQRRLDLLIEHGVLMITPYVDSAKLGLTIHVHLNINVSPEKYSSAIGEIAQLTEIRWVAVTTGPFDVVAEGFFASPDHLHEFIKTRLSPISGIRSVETSVILSLEKFAFHWDEIREVADHYPPAHIPFAVGDRKGVKRAAKRADGRENRREPERLS